MEELKCFARSALLWNGRRIEVRFAEIDDRLVCIGLEIGPKLNDEERFVNVKEDDLKPLTAAEVRFPFRRLVEAGLQSALLVRTGTGDFAADIQALVADTKTLETARAEPPKRTGRPPTYGREHYAKVARIYREHVNAGGRAPTKAVQKVFQVEKSTAAKWVSKARELEELEPVKPKEHA